MEKTTAGLPNTCAGCGKAITSGEWYAKDDETAVSGLGFHSLQCAAKHQGISGYVPPPKQTAATRRTVEKQRPKVTKAESSVKKTKQKTE